MNKKDFEKMRRGKVFYYIGNDCFETCKFKKAGKSSEYYEYRVDADVVETTEDPLLDSYDTSICGDNLRYCFLNKQTAIKAYIKMRTKEIRNYQLDIARLQGYITKINSEIENVKSLVKSPNGD